MLTEQGKTLALACKEAQVAVQSYYRWRREYGDVRVSQAKQLKELVRESARHKRIVADLLLGKAMLKGGASGNW